MSRPARLTPRLATCGFFFLNGAAIGSWAAHIPFAKDRLGISTSTLGLCLLAMAAGALIAMPIAGQLLNRRSSAGMVRIGALVEPLLLMLPLYAPSPLTLGLALLILGLANGLLDVSMNAHGAAIERSLHRPTMSSLHGAWSVGGLVGAGLAAIGNALGADPHAQLVAIGLGLLALAIACGPRLGSVSAQTTSGGGGGLVLPNRRALLLGALAAALMLAEGAMIDWSALYLRRDLALSASVAAAGYAAFAAGMALGRLTGDRLNETLGAARLLRGGSALAAVVLGGLLAIAQPVVALPALVLLGFAVANGVPLLFSAAGRLPGIAPAPALAAVSTTGYGGLLLGPPLVGFLAGATSLPLALGFCAALLGGVALLAGRVAGGALLTAGAEPLGQPARSASHEVLL